MANGKGYSSLSHLSLCPLDTPLIVMSKGAFNVFKGQSRINWFCTRKKIPCDRSGEKIAKNKISDSREKKSPGKKL